jgi:AcrR family transcriptional regulator
MATEKTKKAIIDAFMTALAAKSFSEIGLGEIAEGAGVSLGDLRDAYDGKISILADFARRIDRVVLDGGDGGSSEESARDRLFDILMRRLDVLAPHKAAFGHLEQAARRDPGLLLCLNRLALDSARFMLASAGVSTGGLRGQIRAQGLIVMISRVLPVWRDDRDPDQSKTMAALDRALEKAESWSHRSERATDALCAIARRVKSHRPGRKPTERASEPPAAEQPAA